MTKQLAKKIRRRGEHIAGCTCTLCVKPEEEHHYFIYDLVTENNIVMGSLISELNDGAGKNSTIDDYFEVAEYAKKKIFQRNSDFFATNTLLLTQYGQRRLEKKDYAAFISCNYDSLATSIRYLTNNLGRKETLVPMLNTFLLQFQSMLLLDAEYKARNICIWLSGRLEDMRHCLVKYKEHKMLSQVIRNNVFYVGLPNEIVELIRDFIGFPFPHRIESRFWYASAQWFILYAQLRDTMESVMRCFLCSSFSPVIN
jgi:hypothetical protein